MLNRDFIVKESEYEAISRQICYASTVANAIAESDEGSRDTQTGNLIQLLREMLEKIEPAYDDMATIAKGETA